MNQVIIDGETITVVERGSVRRTCIGFYRWSIFDKTLELEHTDVSGVLGKVKWVVAVNQ